MQNNPRKQDISQELRNKRQDVPDIHSDVAVVIDALTQVCVDLDASTEDFYKVTTSDGIEGFCMRKYIALSK